MIKAQRCGRISRGQSRPFAHFPAPRCWSSEGNGEISVEDAVLNYRNKCLWGSLAVAARCLVNSGSLGRADGIDEDRCALL